MMKKLLYFLPALFFMFLCGWIVAPPETKNAVISVWFYAILLIALALVVSVWLGVLWLWHKAKQASYIQPDPSGNFPLAPRGDYWVNLNLVGSEQNPPAWALWQLSTSHTSQPTVPSIPIYKEPPLITSGEDSTHPLLVEGKAKVRDL